MHFKSILRKSDLTCYWIFIFLSLRQKKEEQNFVPLFLKYLSNSA
ncbi:unknown protein [Waddlia chondrophila 2032/99]|uniref:Uncharacterized protein n=1 Tax=Waddlia chondrophila 2032/99 TaxID=765953 RepID=F8LBJ8_9BACT|nr:unknown protein [Waddlia chondrophila 2032/99]